MKRTMKKFWLLPVLMLVSLSINAAPISPVQMLRSVSNRMISSLQQNRGRLNPALVRKIVYKNLVPYVAKQRMAASVVGRQYWTTASSQQRKTFVRQFTRLVVNFYSAALTQFNNDVVRFYPLRVNYRKQSTVSVRTVIVRRNGQRIPVTYNLVRAGHSWKVYDFSVENISMVQNYRAQFSGILSKSGLSGLNRRLIRHNRAA